MSHVKRAKTRNIKALRRDNRCSICGNYLSSEQEQERKLCNSCASQGQKTL
jgi:formylmethanofuran dehydrogenase subunit E